MRPASSSNFSSHRVERGSRIGINEDENEDEAIPEFIEKIEMSTEEVRKSSDSDSDSASMRCSGNREWGKFWTGKVFDVVFSGFLSGF